MFILNLFGLDLRLKEMFGDSAMEADKGLYLNGREMRSFYERVLNCSANFA